MVRIDPQTFRLELARLSEAECDHDAWYTFDVATEESICLTCGGRFVDRGRPLHCWLGLTRPATGPHK